MGLLLSTRRALIGGKGSYNDLVLGTGPIAYWPQDESTGAVARCLVNPAQNGAYTGVTLANDTAGPFGMPAPFYDGANDYCNIHSAALAAAFSGTAGSLVTWARVVNVGAWTDGITRMLSHLSADANNYTRMEKNATNTRFRGRFIGGGVGGFQTENPITTTAWFCGAITWDQSANQALFYRDAAQIGAAIAPIGVWAGALAAATTTIGAASTVPINVWHGWLGPAAIWDRVLTLAEIASLYAT